MLHPDDVTSPWIRIRRWLQSNAAASAQALNPPATDTDIQHLNDSLGFRIPQVLETWLRLNNGSSAKDSRIPIPGGFQLVPHLDSKIFPGGEVFLDCQSIIDRHQQFLRIADGIEDDDWWKPSWIPVLAETDAHYGLLLDVGHADESAPVPVLAYRETDYATHYASSLGHVLNAVANALEDRREGGVLTHGRHASVKDGRVIWD
ncbi:SMI1/KNR4 family protein [Streptomyces tauricus]|uniref:SMI1/KNR4 family protein n=1 Tax=Streptomyces tauricus TaxID=68274 RepID=UPI002244725F|nr:SMI1/KNR4 family protein [Streptomyces tauricus]MCW8103149.1 SMI1/KNR4 family protein [Streptomyces tauricus]